MNIHTILNMYAEPSNFSDALWLWLLNLLKWLISLGQAQPHRRRGMCRVCIPGWESWGGTSWNLPPWSAFGPGLAGLRRLVWAQGGWALSSHQWNSSLFLSLCLAYLFPFPFLFLLLLGIEARASSMLSTHSATEPCPQSLGTRSIWWHSTLSVIDHTHLLEYLDVANLIWDLVRKIDWPVQSWDCFLTDLVIVQVHWNSRLCCYSCKVISIFQSWWECCLAPRMFSPVGKRVRAQKQLLCGDSPAVARASSSFFPPSGLWLHPLKSQTWC